MIMHVLNIKAFIKHTCIHVSFLLFLFRWPPRHDQWWECKFASEGIIDQGGGFRDSLADMGDELCPTDSDVPVPLPFFVRAPNQVSCALSA